MLGMSPPPLTNNPLQSAVVNTATADMPPAVLLGYQQRWIADGAALKVAEKSRRIGLTWAEAADDVLIAASAGGSNVFYISAAEDMAREYIEACAMWAKAFSYAASQIGEGIYDDGVDPERGQRLIKTFELNFPATGRRILALSSRPTNLRGKQGVVVLDEAAFAPDLAGMLKAALAMLMWGDKVRIISTHDGAENPFYELIQEIRAGRKGAATVHRITFADAVEEGLYRRVCLRRGIAWSAQAEREWVESVRSFYGPGAAEELDVIPSQGGTAYLSLALIQERMVPHGGPDGPWIVRGRWDDAFARLPEDVRRYAIAGWLAEQVQPLLAKLSPERRHAFGQDFARNRDQSIIVVGEQGADLVRRPRIVIELANCPFSSQEQVLFHVIDALPRFRGGAMDATGNGAALAEAAAQRYGFDVVEQVKLNDTFYLQHMPKLRAGLQDGTLTGLPRDELLQDDLRAVELINGIPKIPKQTTQSAAARAVAADGGDKGSRRHGDFAIALFLFEYAWTRDVGEIDYTSAGGKSLLRRGEVDPWTGDGEDDEAALGAFGGQSW